MGTGEWEWKGETGMETGEQAWKVGNGRGKVFSRGCEGLTIPVYSVMFRKFRTVSKEWILGSIPLQRGPVKTGTNYVQKR